MENENEDENEDTEDRTAEDVNADAGADAMDVDTQSASASASTKRARSARTRSNPAWTLDIPLGTDEEAERWRNGDMAEVYENALRTLQRLQGEGDTDASKEAGSEGNALATTVGKAERAGRAAEVVESM